MSALLTPKPEVKEERRTPARRDGGGIVIRNTPSQQRGSSSGGRRSLPPPPPPKKVKTEYDHLVAAQESLFDADADDSECLGLAAVLQESLNDVLLLDKKAACAWSLRVHAKITGVLFLDLTGDDHEAGPSRVKDEEEKVKQEADGGAAVKDEPLDFTIFDRYCRYR